MTLNEAIQHAKEIYLSSNECKECREEHKQLYQWLKSLSSLQYDQHWLSQQLTQAERKLSKL